MSALGKIEMPALAGKGRGAGGAAAGGGRGNQSGVAGSRHWVQIRRIYELDFLVCPRCGATIYREYVSNTSMFILWCANK